MALSLQFNPQIEFNEFTQQSEIDQISSLKGLNVLQIYKMKVCADCIRSYAVSGGDFTKSRLLNGDAGIRDLTFRIHTIRVAMYLAESNKHFEAKSALNKYLTTITETPKSQKIVEQDIPWCVLL